MTNPVRPDNKGHTSVLGKCGKVCFDKKSAETKKNFLGRNAGKDFEVYHCDRCQSWHLRDAERRRAKGVGR